MSFPIIIEKKLMRFRKMNNFLNVILAKFIRFWRKSGDRQETKLFHNIFAHCNIMPNVLLTRNASCIVVGLKVWPTNVIQPYEWIFFRHSAKLFETIYIIFKLFIEVKALHVKIDENRCIWRMHWLKKIVCSTRLHGENKHLISSNSQTEHGLYSRL